MKLETENFNIKEVNWRFFPNIHQLSQYLLQSDLIQLSLTCSIFRNKLNSIIFRKLDLFEHGKATNSKYKYENNIFMYGLNKIYSDKYHFVKHCVLQGDCSSYFVGKLVSTFSYITKLELYSIKDDYRYYISNTINRLELTPILNHFNKLEVLVLDCALIKFPETGGITNFKLPTCLKVFDIVGDEKCSLSFDPIENINGKYTKLKKVTIINNSMLTNISPSIKSLIEVTIYSNVLYCPMLLTQLFSLNSQLKKVSISLKFIEFNVINAILQLRKLDVLNITYYSGVNTNELGNLAINTSIKHLNISCNITQNILLPILSSVKSIHTLELSNYVFSNFRDIDWNSHNIKVHLLHLNCAWNVYSDIYEFLNSGIFDKVRFSKKNDLEYYNETYNLDKLDDWKVIQDDPSVIDDFYLVRKSTELD
jgi:hypothetical protein